VQEKTVRRIPLLTVTLILSWSLARAQSAWGDCFAKEFTTRFRASPSIIGERGVENEARILCSQRFPPKPYVPSP
jgi:hypothetical protein